MYPIPQLPSPRCDCCGLPIQPQMGDFCPRCGYPVNIPQEERFLEESIRNLQRVATYGGAQATVANLLLRYQNRLSVIRQQLNIAPTRQNVAPTTSPEAVQPLPMQYPNLPKQPNNPVAPSTQMPPVRPVEKKSAITVPLALPVQSVQMPMPPVSSAPQYVFSLRSFFADQTINIVSSLGAFLILIGSLSFVATTSNLFLSFLVLFIVHLLFAIVGFVFSRFPSFRFISRIYTAIFALLVPLVGFSGYRLVAGHLVQLSAPTVVAIAAAYAAIVYTLLAISQQYKPFGYFAAVALVVADCAVAYALQLNYWWWPVLLMPLAFVTLLSLSNNGALFSTNRAVLREPTRILMYVCIGVLCLDILLSYAYMFASEVVSNPFVEIRIATAVMLLLALVWTCLYCLVTKRFVWFAFVPYQFLGLAVAMAFVFEMHAVSFGLLFTAIAVFYHGIALVARHPLHYVKHLRNHMEGIALVLVAFVPLLVAAQVPFTLAVAIVYRQRNIPFFVNGDTVLALIALIASCALTISIILSRTGLRRIPTSTDTAWPWLLLLSGFLFTWAYSINALVLHIVPVYAFLALTLAFLLGTIVVRRFISTPWSNPLDVIVLAEAACTLLLHLSYDIDAQLALLFLFAILSYGVVVYQRRSVWLFLPLVFMLFALPVLVERPRIMLLLGIGLPIVALVLAKIEEYRSGYTSANDKNIWLFSWHWPILATGLFYGFVVCILDAVAPVSTVQSWLGIPFSVALEMALFAVISYIIAVVTRQQCLLVVTIVFAVAGLLIPSNPLWIMACIAAVAALFSVGMGRVVARLWVAPLYVIALLAALLVGINGYTQGINTPFPTAIPDALLLYAVIAYALLIVERQPRLLGLVALFALWGLVLILRLNADVFKSFSAQVAFPTYYLTAVALVATVIALVAGRVGKMRDGAPSSPLSAFTWSWPWYSTALFAIVLTVIWNTLMGGIQVSGVTVYGSLFAFILLACVVMFVERRRELLLLPIALVLWAIVQSHWQLWQEMGVLSLLFFLVFTIPYIWQLFPGQVQSFSQSSVYTLLSFVGQSIILLVVIGQGGLLPNQQALAHIGIGVLLLLAVQLFLYGWMEREKYYWTLYVAGLLVTFAIPWELSTFQYTRIEWLTLAPATYLIVVAPFLSRNEHIAYYARLGQLCSILGASLLLLPTLWSSFSEPNIEPTFILAGEALALLLLGVLLRTRFFVLSGAALVIVSAMHALFLPSLGLPPSLALTIMGAALLALATALSLARHRLQAVWTRLD